MYQVECKHRMPGWMGTLLQCEGKYEMSRLNAYQHGIPGFPLYWENEKKKAKSYSWEKEIAGKIWKRFEKHPEFGNVWRTSHELKLLITNYPDEIVTIWSEMCCSLLISKGSIL